jgi:histidine ammonia-lyase
VINLDGSHLTIEEIIGAARRFETVQIAPEACVEMSRSAGWVARIVASDSPVYGINTGFGIFADQRIPPAESSRLSRNLILSHAVAAGPSLPQEVVRAAMVVRANTLAKGFSGVRPELVELMTAMLNRRVTPVVPSQGSLGSSGDLAPLSHLGLVMTRDEKDDGNESGWADYAGKVLLGKTAMARAGLERIILGPKEGLALNNGATFSAAIGALSVYDAQNLLVAANIALALSLEALVGCSAAFDARIQEARGRPGQIYVAEQIRQLTQGSSLVDSGGRIQDAYSLRCAPQVHGAVHETLAYARHVMSTEINAATDNPLLFDENTVFSGGNFHGEPVGLVMDFVGIALAELAAISERRTFRLLDGKLNGGLPAMLVDTLAAAGLNSGLMMPQYTAASLVLENQTLASPDSVHSLPTSAEQEDHNANSMTAARHAAEILTNTRRVIAIELYTGARAMDLRLRRQPEALMGAGTKAAYQLIRREVPYRPGDAWWGPEIEAVDHLVESEALIDAVAASLSDS